MIKGLLFFFTHRKIQWGYFAISGLFFIYVIFTLIISSRRAAITRNAKVGRLFTAISVYTIVVWSFYPIIWILSVGIQKISVDTEILLYAIVRLPFRSLSRVANYRLMYRLTFSLEHGFYFPIYVFRRVMFRLKDGGFMVLARQKELQLRGEDCWKMINRPLIHTTKSWN